MFNKIGDLVTQMFAQPSEVAPDKLNAELAVCVLLVEVMRSDDEKSPSEIKRIEQLLSSQFGLDPDTINKIITDASQESDTATDFYRFTSQINNSYSIEEKIDILGLMWQVALADGNIDTIEEHTIRRVADLLHLRHSEFIRSKLKATDKL